VIALTAGQDAIYSGEVHRWLVLAPLLVGTDTWRNEPSEWSHLEDMDVVIAAGEDSDARQRAVESTAQFTVLNYENLSWLMEHYPRIKRADSLPYDGLICDEIDKLKDVSSNRFKDFRNRIGKFKKRVGLTGTLIPNRLEELWGQAYMVDAGETFGRSFYEFRKAHFYPTDYHQRKWAPFPSTEQYLLEQLDGLAYRLPAVGLPPVVAKPSYMFDLPAEIQDRYDELEREYYLEVEDNLGQPREIEAANTAVLQGKLQQICAGFSYVDGGKEAVWHSYERFKWLGELQHRLQWNNQQLLTVYHFNEELDELKRQYPKLAYLGKGVSNIKKRHNIAAWNAGDIPMLALHAQSAGHGLNLQKSGAHNIAFLTIPWSGGMFKQVCGRLARRGQVAEQVNVWTALNRNTVDENVFAVVTGKLDTMHSFQDALYAQQCPDLSK
jgi:hypothetical protein